MSSRLISACILFLFLASALPTRLRVSAGTGAQAFLYTVTHNYEPLAWMHGGDRFGSGANIFISDARGRRSLVPDFAASADPAVSFDGQRVLFSGKQKAGDRWQIWEIAFAERKPRRMVSASEDCARPFYLPGDHIVYARKVAGRFLIEVAALAGGKPLPLTYGPANFLPTEVLRDGRILFQAAYPLGGDISPEIYAVYSDGSGMESYRCDHGKKRSAGKQVGSGDIVFATDAGLARFTSSRAQEVELTVPAGDYAGDVAEIASGDWLLSWRADAKTHFQLMDWTPGASVLRPVVSEPAADVIQPVLIATRAVPKRHPSGLHDWPNANLLCLNAYTSKYKFATNAIQTVRLYTRDLAGNSRLLGTAAVEKDGSFFVQVPTEQPLQIELLDSNGKTLQREFGYFWMRRGEQRVCVGCHAGPETAPENAVPAILLKSTTPADMTGTGAHGATGGH